MLTLLVLSGIALLWLVRMLWRLKRRVDDLLLSRAQLRVALKPVAEWHEKGGCFSREDFDGTC
ncbi:MAG: hypothetical protein CMJ46_03210, partial [Planctomyces sp.]|nr:hypothetical protein [Planctomyces sp.]